MKTKVIIVGSGPSGLTCANYLKQHHIPFLLLEKNPIPGKKLLITGNSRCNVTNNLSKRAFMNALTVNSKFLYSTLNNFSTNEIISFYDSLDVQLVLDKEFKYFPSTNKSVTVRDALTRNIKDNILLHQEVVAITKDTLFSIKTKQNTYQSEYLVIATGSNSYPQTGSTGFGIKIAKQFNINTIPFYPAETSIYSNYINNHSDQLMGISITNSDIRILKTKIKHQGDILFTHFGLSGPGIYHLSEEIYKQLPENDVITVSLTEYNEQELRDIIATYRETDKLVKSLLEEVTKKRIAKFFIDEKLVVNKKVKEISKKMINIIIELLLRFRVEVTKVESKEKAYVNGGGVDTLELDPKTFMTKKVENLFFIGETVDVHGPIGGFNITIGSSMGYTTALAIKNLENM